MKVRKTDNSTPARSATCDKCYKTVLPSVALEATKDRGAIPARDGAVRTRPRIGAVSRVRRPCTAGFGQALDPAHGSQPCGTGSGTAGGISRHRSCAAAGPPGPGPSRRGDYLRRLRRMLCVGLQPGSNPRFSASSWMILVKRRWKRRQRMDLGESSTFRAIHDPRTDNIHSALRVLWSTKTALNLRSTCMPISMAAFSSSNWFVGARGT